MRAVANNYLNKLSQDLPVLYTNMGGSLQAKKARAVFNLSLCTCFIISWDVHQVT